MNRQRTKTFGNTLAQIDLVEERGAVRLHARLGLGDLVLHEPQDARHARMLHQFWSARLGAPTGLCGALLWVAQQFEDLRR